MEQRFGFGQIANTTPMWAKWMFRIVFFLNKIIVAYIAATNLIDSETKYEITLLITLLIDPAVFGLSKMFGLNLEEENKASVYADDPNPPIVGDRPKDRG